MTEMCVPQQSVPPVMAFHLGSLGFLTPFEFDNFQEQVTNVLEGNVLYSINCSSSA
jgi:NAD+ kinase